MIFAPMNNDRSCFFNAIKALPPTTPSIDPPSSLMKIIKFFPLMASPIPLNPSK